MRTYLSFALCLLPTIALAQLPDAAMVPPGGTDILQKIVAEVRNAYNRQERPMVIFDLDGTLFDNRARHFQILKEYGEQELKSVRPDAAARLATLTLPAVQYRLTDTLSGIGVTEDAIVNNAAVFWSQRFFSDDYLKYDVPPPGAVNFVRTLYSTGARIVYLSGRDAPRQLIGTVKSLRDQGYPIGIQGTELIMKPTQNVQDAMFKQQVTNYLRQYGKVVATFDNEPSNANQYRRSFPDSICVLFQAPHSPNPPPLLPNIVGTAGFAGF